MSDIKSDVEEVGKAIAEQAKAKPDADDFIYEDYKESWDGSAKAAMQKHLELLIARAKIDPKSIVLPEVISDNEIKYWAYFWLEQQLNELTEQQDKG